MKWRILEKMLRAVLVFFTVNTQKRLYRLTYLLDDLERYALELKIVLECKSEEYRNEVEYIKKNGLSVFPYKQTKICKSVECGFDKEKDLPFVLHKMKRLYFPKSFSLSRCESMYRQYIETECIIGGAYREKAPHQYQSENFKIEEGDILVDVGCAEALLSLDSIDIVDKLYLIEADKNWIPALNATFSEYMDKVVIINKYISDIDSNTKVRLDTVLGGLRGRNVFVKMDIEGAEVSALRCSKKYLSDNDNIKLACCTYHCQSDANDLKLLLDDMGYQSVFSEGYMLFYTKDTLEFPYFRHGVIRGWKQ